MLPQSGILRDRTAYSKSSNHSNIIAKPHDPGGRLFRQSEVHPERTQLHQPATIQQRLYQSWLVESGQNDKLLFCLTAAMIAAHQERS
jgi:hypothetical protein